MALTTLELELHKVVSHLIGLLETEHGSSTKTVGSLTMEPSLQLPWACITGLSHSGTHVCACRHTYSHMHTLPSHL